MIGPAKGDAKQGQVQSGELFIDLIEKLIRELHVHFP
jgi:hypothetical protein